MRSFLIGSTGVFGVDRVIMGRTMGLGGEGMMYEGNKGIRYRV